MPDTFNHLTLVASSIATAGTPKLITTTTNGASVASVSFPLHNLTGDLYVLVRSNVGSLLSAPSAANMTNYGRKYTNADPICTVNVSEDTEVWIYNLTSNTTVYPTAGA